MRSKEVKLSRRLPSVIYAPILREIQQTPPRPAIRHDPRPARPVIRPIPRRDRVPKP